jgi:hypothetical protein
MRLKRTLLAGAAVLALAGGVLAQTTIYLLNLNGTETVEIAIGGGGGSGVYTTTAAIRNGTSFKPFSGLTGVQTYTAKITDSTLYWVGTAPTSWTITTPAAPFDGEIITLATDTTLTSMVTLTANTGQTLNSSYSSQTLTAKTSVEFQYSVATTKWYELR